MTPDLKLTQHFKHLKLLKGFHVQCCRVFPSVDSAVSVDRKYKLTQLAAHVKCADQMLLRQGIR